MKPVTVIEPADTELRKETAWYRDRDPRVATDFTSEVRRTLKFIEEFPQIGSRMFGVDDPDIRSFPVHGFPYRVVFLDLPDRTEVIAFAHKRRRPRYFLRRIRRR